jgi:hypothetical protein
MILPRDYEAINCFMTLISTFLLSFLIVLAAFGAMAVGVMLGHRKIRGSCGGIGSGDCELCSHDQRATEPPVTQEQAHGS